MRKIVLYAFFLLFSVWASAQIANPSFEQTDTLGNLSNWTVKQGYAKKLSAIQLGIIPFTASDGNFFTLVSSDTQTTTIKPGILQQQFVIADTPGSFWMNYLYIPDFIGQHATIKLYMSKWNGLSRDTILYVSDTIPVIAEGNRIPIQWNTVAITLKEKYRNNSIPDSAWIDIQNDDALTPSKEVRLYLDNLLFDQWAVGIKEQTQEMISFYPNPVNNMLTITSVNITNQHTIQLIALDGKQYTPQASIIDNKLNLYTESIPNGLYVLSIQTPAGFIFKRILIYHD